MRIRPIFHAWQYHNAWIHTDKIIKEWVDYREIDVAEWPLYASDLISNLAFILDTLTSRPVAYLTDKINHRYYIPSYIHCKKDLSVNFLVTKKKKFSVKNIWIFKF